MIGITAENDKSLWNIEKMSIHSALGYIFELNIDPIKCLVNF